MWSFWSWDTYEKRKNLFVKFQESLTTGTKGRNRPQPSKNLAVLMNGDRLDEDFDSGVRGMPRYSFCDRSEYCSTELRLEGFGRAIECPEMDSLRLYKVVVALMILLLFDENCRINCQCFFRDDDCVRKLFTRSLQSIAPNGTSRKLRTERLRCAW
jgi:hypothetical protein